VSDGDFSCGVLGVLAKMAVGGYNERVKKERLGFLIALFI